MDGRGVAGEEAPVGLYAPAQMPGNLIGTNTSGDMMDKNCRSPHLSDRIAQNTRVETHDDPKHRKRLILHGDDHGAHQEEDGCADIRAKRQVAAFGAENVDAIAPVAFELGSKFGVGEYGVDIDYVREALTVGGERAADDSLWNLTPREVVLIATSRGAEYATYTGSHREWTGVAEMRAGHTFGSRQYALTNRDAAGNENQVFGLSLGEYAQTTFRDAIRRGETPERAAQKVMRGIIHPVTLFKAAGNEALSLVLVGADQPAQLKIPA
jgi:hypothetical protein